MATDTLVRIVLGGSLGKRFGAEWKLRLTTPSPAEAIRAIDANTGGEFRRYLAGQGTKRFYKIALARKDNLLGPDELHSPTGRGDIYILPTVRGREKGATKILAAVALAIVSYVVFGPGGVLASKLALTVSMSAAASLAISGVVQLLTPVPSFDQGSSAEGSRSDVFQGNAAAIAQGMAIPLLYGRGLAPALPISLSFTAFDKSISNSFAPQEYDIEYGEGGIVNYVPRNPTPEDNLPA